MTGLEELQALLAKCEDADRLAETVRQREGRIELSELEGLSRCQRLDVARALLNWNCNQPVSDAKHDQHYRQYIAPIHKQLDEEWQAFVERSVNGA